MALITIEYGSLASSETMNKNFQYLDDKISETTGSFTTSISSVSSNIATLNTNLSDLSDKLDETKNDIEETINGTNSCVITALMLPDWSACISISKPKSYIAPSNGYVLINPVANSSGNLVINGVTVYFKYRGHEDDNAAILVPYPVKKGDDVTLTSSAIATYFLPVVEKIVIEGEEEEEDA